MHQVAKLLTLGGAIAAAGIGAVVAVAPRETSTVKPCDEARDSQASPTGVYEAAMIIKTCAWGFGQAAESVDIKITKTGSGGWFMHVPIEYDSTSEDRGTTPPTVKWTGSNELSINVVSNVQTGTLVATRMGLTVIRKYGKP